MLLGSNFAFKLENLSSYKAPSKVERTLNFALKIPYLAIFRLELENTIVMLDFSTFNLSKYNISYKKKKNYFTRALSNFSKRKTLLKNKKSLNLGQKFPSFGILGSKFKKLTSYLKSASSNLLICKVSSKNEKTLNLGSKIPYLDIFGLQFNKNYYQIFNQPSQICETMKFHSKR